METIKFEYNDKDFNNTLKYLLIGTFRNPGSILFITVFIAAMIIIFMNFFKHDPAMQLWILLLYPLIGYTAFFTIRRSRLKKNLYSQLKGKTIVIEIKKEKIVIHDEENENMRTIKRSEIERITNNYNLTILHLSNKQRLIYPARIDLEDALNK